MEFKMKTVENGGDGVYIVNEHITVSNVEPNPSGDGMIYDVEWKDDFVTEEEALAVAEDFLTKTVKGMAISAYEEKNEIQYNG